MMDLKVRFIFLGLFFSVFVQWVKFHQYAKRNGNEVISFIEEALFATIVERPDSRLTEGRIGVSFTSESEPKVSKAKIYTLVESNAYFEMYQHVLEVLKVKFQKIWFSLSIW